MPEIRLPRHAVTRVDLPAVCVATGASEGVEYHRTPFQFVPLWARLTIVPCGVFALIFIFMSMQRVQVDVPMTPDAHRAWKRAKRTMGVLVVAALSVLLLPMLIEPELLFVGVIAFIALLVGVIAYSLVVLKKAGPICKRIDDEVVRLEIPSGAAVTAIEERLGLGAGTPEPTGASGSQADDPRDELDRRLDSELERY